MKESTNEIINKYLSLLDQTINLPDTDLDSIPYDSATDEISAIKLALIIKAIPSALEDSLKWSNKVIMFYLRESSREQSVLDAMADIDEAIDIDSISDYIN